MNEPRTVLDALTVYQPGAHKRRLGKPNDGGYVICSGGFYDCFLSGGVCDDVSFEAAFLAEYPKLLCRAFDGTVGGLPALHDRIVFERKNIAATEGKFTTNLHAALDAHEDVFVKMDVEGGEYPWLDSLSEGQVTAIKQLVIEFHYPYSAEQWSTLIRLARTHWLVHLHANNHAKTRLIEGITIPDVFECTYLRRTPGEPDLDRNRVSIPGPLDQPNARGVAEIHLTGHPYTAGTPCLAL